MAKYHAVSLFFLQERDFDAYCFEEDASDEKDWADAEGVCSWAGGHLAMLRNEHDRHRVASEL